MRNTAIVECYCERSGKVSLLQPIIILPSVIDQKLLFPLPHLSMRPGPYNYKEGRKEGRKEARKKGRKEG